MLLYLWGKRQMEFFLRRCPTEFENSRFAYILQYQGAVPWQIGCSQHAGLTSYMYVYVVFPLKTTSNIFAPMEIFLYFLMGNTDPALYSWIVLHHTTDTLVAKKVRNEKHEKVSGHRGEKISIFQSHMQSAVSQSGFPLGHFTDFICSFIKIHFLS